MGIAGRHGRPNRRLRARSAGVVLALTAAGLVVLGGLGDAVADPALDASVADVSCWSEQGCVAVGSNTANYAIYPSTWELTGSAWHLLSTNQSPLVIGGGDLPLASVSCDAASTCIAVGDTGEMPLSQQLAGTTWTSMYPPISHSLNIGLTGVSCPATAWCMAIGSDFITTTVDVFDGSQWRIAAAPANMGVVSFSCASRRFCVAIGGNTKTWLGATFNGSAWKAVPLPTRSGEQLDSISCPAAGACVAVGSKPSPTIFGGSPTQVLLRYHAGRFSRMAARVPAGATPVAVSCTAPDACVAVGSLARNGGPFAERLSRGTWSSLATINPNPGTSTVSTTPAFTSISCLPGGQCMAAGGGTSPFSEILSRGGPTLLPMPVP